MNEDDKKIRDFESGVLDRHHENYPFYLYGEDIVIPFLLQIYGDTERHRDRLIEKGHTETNLSAYISNIIHGIGHCTRWIKEKSHPLTNDTSGTDTGKLLEMAAEFLNWGTGYHMIAQEFVTWSRKIKSVLLDETERTITFLNPDNYDYSGVYGKQLLYSEQMQAVYLTYPHDEMEVEFTEWIKDIDFSNPPIANHIKWARGRNSKSYPLLLLKMEEILFPELPSTTDFIGYNLDQLRIFYALFFLNFHFIRWVESVLDTQSGDQELSFGSNPLYLERERFVLLASIITGLSREVAEAIIADLTFNPNNFHTSPSIQPFILSSSGTYYILPNLFSQLEPSRMILGAINKSGKKKVYDRLINLIEKYNLNRLYKSVNKSGSWDCFLEKVLKYQGKSIHPDLIIVDASHKMVCVIDYKHFIGPITASEVDYKMIELSKGAKQVQSYITTLEALDKIGVLDISGFEIVGILVTHKPLPVPVSSEINIPIIDSVTFLQLVGRSQAEGQKLNKLMLYIKSLEATEQTVDVFEAEIEVGNWKIIRSLNKIKL